MTKRPQSLQATTNWAELGSNAVDAGDFESARDYFEHAVRHDKNSAAPRFHLALVCDALGDRAVAAAQLTSALRLKPDMSDAARRLGMILGRYSLPGDVELDVLGLRAALQHDLVNRDQIAEAAVYYLARRSPLKDALDQGRLQGWPEAARQLCLKKTGELLKNNLFVEALRDSLIRMPELEQLLSAMRRVLLLEVPQERFEDKSLLTFTITLARQCWTNEFVWAVGADEKEAAVQKATKAATALEGDPAAGIELLRAALYTPVPSLVPADIPLDRVNAIRPLAVRDFVLSLVESHRDENARMATLLELAPVTDDVSLRVAAQYGAYPYPRWTSLNYLLRPGEWRKSMGRFFPAERLQFMDAPFEVLIAGCGTGVQAIAAARAYGPNARVTAIDISKPSLGYAARMAEHFGVRNIAFQHADIRDIANTDAFASRFHVIESVGVLHHMADPFGGWRALLKALHPQGMMLIGLYSETARSKWMALRSEPAYPGAGCDDEALRQYRSDLFQRTDAELGAEFKGIRDLYCTSGFRDLLLHVSEKRHSIPEIGAFLNDTGLRFRGFANLQDFDRLQDAYPNEEWPGALSHWAAFEDAHPMTFAGMYRLWCDRA